MLVGARIRRTVAGLGWAGLAVVPIPTALAQQGALQEVVVTAQKREQALQDVSAAVTAVGAARLADARIANLEDLQFIVPNINFGNDFNTAKLFIRGVGTNTSVAGSDPGVALHVDGAVISRPEAQLTSLFDLERVEVLRGPQGTLYGRNSVGGSINLITAKPTPTFDGYARLTLGNYDALVAEGAISGPLTDRLQGRIAFQSSERSGFGINPVTGNDVDDLKKRMARAQLRFVPGDTVDLLLSLEGYKQDDASNAIKFRRASFPDVPALPALGEGGIASDPRDLATEFDPQNNVEAWAVTGTVNWTLSERVTLASITNYRDFKVGLVQDLDSSGIVNSLATTGQSTTIQNRNTYSEQFSEELQLQYTGGRIEGVVGLYYFDEEFGSGPNSIGLTPTTGQQQNIDVLLAAGVAPREVLDQCGLTSIVGPDASPPRFCGFATHNAEAYAAFGQLTVDVTPQLALKLGGRYSSEDRSQENPGVIIARGGLGPVLIFTPEVARDERSFDDFTPEGGVEWRPSDDLLLYYTYSEGFKSGTGEATITTSQIIGPETIQNHEAGVKTTWLDGRLNLNVAAFSYDLQGLQIAKTINDPVAGFVTLFQNAAETSAEGVEVEAFWAPANRFRLNAALSWVDSQFDEFETSDPLNPDNVTIPPATAPANPTIVSLAGHRTRNSPEWAGNVHAEIDFPLANSAFLTLAGDVSYKDEQFFSEFQREIEGADAYTLIDASLKYTAPEGNLFGSLWVKNLTDEFEAAGTFALATARQIGVTWLPPRTYGLTIGYSF